MAKDFGHDNSKLRHFFTSSFSDKSYTIRQFAFLVASINNS